MTENHKVVNRALVPIAYEAYICDLCMPLSVPELHSGLKPMAVLSQMPCDLRKGVYMVHLGEREVGTRMVLAYYSFWH